MNGAIPARATSRPLIAPMAPQTASGTRSAGSIPHWEAQAASTPPSAKTEPTDRSIPPVMITSVIPRATIDRKDAWTVTPRALSRLAKESKTNEETRTTSSRTARTPWRWSSSAARCRPAGRAVAARSSGGTKAGAEVAFTRAFIGIDAPGRHRRRRG
ncbi:hypothetical protein M2266_006169 [Streptomyces sp. SPB162]|nr:hypothetical protein [Streptomyces sp. SPB162]